MPSGGTLYRFAERLLRDRRPRSPFRSDDEAGADLRRLRRGRIDGRPPRRREERPYDAARPIEPGASRML
jgi:hypothetical protein